MLTIVISLNKVQSLCVPFEQQLILKCFDSLVTFAVVANIVIGFVKTGAGFMCPI